MPARLPPSGTFESVSAGYYHNCGVTSSGSLECWGLNSDGQATPPPGTFESVSAGYWHTCGIKNDGSMECWGSDGDGAAFDYGQVSDAP